MKRAIVFALTAVLSVSISPASAAPISAGAACKKLGQKITQSGNTYICQKSGRKQIWKKSSALPLSPPAAQTPKPSLTPKPEPAPSTPAAPTSFDDLIQNYKGIAYAAWSKSRDVINKSESSNISIQMVVGPNTQVTLKDSTVPIKQLTRLFPGYVQPAEIFFIAFNFQDRAWATDQMESLIPNAGSRWVSDMACKTVATCWGGGAFANGKGRYLIIEAMGYLDNNHTSGSLEAHEFTHIMQQMNMNAARAPEEFLYDPWPPTWYWEGQAQFAQHAAIYSNSFETYMRERIETGRGLYANPAVDLSFVQNYFVFNAPKDWQDKYDRGLQYHLGAMFIEILVALKGPESTMELWKQVGNGASFRSAFENIYGIAFDSALPIMAKAMTLQITEA